MAHYLAFFMSGWVIVTIFTVLGVVAGTAYATTVPREWEASASIELPDLPVYVDLTSEGPPPKRVTIDTTGQLAFSKPVLEAIADRNGITEQEAADSLTVSAYPLSRVIILTFKAPTLADAENGANAAAAALAAQRQKLLAGWADRRNAVDLQKELKELNNDSIEQYGYTSVSVRILQQVQEINQDWAQYANGDKARVVNKAKPGKSVPPHPETYITTGAVAGFMIGILWIWWRPRKRGSIEHLPAGFTARS
jgi:uncharacterized protein involved in exopolysaccharide biosynthesis